MPILSGLIEISVYSCGELQKVGSERKIDMKKLVIILALAIMLLTMPNQDTVRPPTINLEMSQTAAMELTETIPARDTETADVSKKEEEILVEIKGTTETNSEPMQIESIVETEKHPMVQETPMEECAEELEVQKAAEQEETVECVSRGDQTLAEYKPQPSGQVNPFENAPPAEIVDQPVEALIGQGEDRPGEGKHF